MQALSVVTEVRIVLTPEEALQLRNEIGQLELNGDTQLEPLWHALRLALSYSTTSDEA